MQFKLSGVYVRLGIVYIHCLLFNTGSEAQKSSLLNFEKATVVDVITREQITTLSSRNVTDIIRTAPGTHHINSRQITYDYDDPMVDKTVQKIFYDAQNRPSYLQSVTTNAQGVPIEAVEKVYNGRDLLQGYKWNNFNGNQSAETYDAGAGKFIPFTFQPSWSPMFQYTPPASTSIQPVNKQPWEIQVKDVFKRGAFNQTTPGGMYGGNTQTTYAPSGNRMVVENKIYDIRGTLRKHIYREYYSDDWGYEEITYYDCYGKKIYFESTWYDDYGYEIETIDVAYENGEPVAYWRDVDDYDADFRQFFNPRTGKFEYINPFNESYANYIWDEAMANAGEPCDNFPRNSFFFGGSLISEDSYERFNTIGFEVIYIRFLNEKFGLTVDGGITFGSQFNVDYTKTMVLGGITYLPFSSLGLNDKFTVSVHALAGIAGITAKSGNFKSSGSDLSGELGVNGTYRINPKWGVEAGAGWNPVFSSGNTSSNYRLRLGLRLFLEQRKSDNL